MKSTLQEISELVKIFGTAPTIETMPRRTLKDKWINGPTAAHVIEEIHTPLNFAYVTFTTGSSAFQNIVGVTYSELEAREEASIELLKRTGVHKGDKILVTYPPLVNVFSASALKKCELDISFLARSSRDAFLVALYKFKPKIIVGESSFIRIALEDAEKMGVVQDLPKKLIILAAGTTLDLDLLPIAKQLLQANVHDLYGCQEFGWICVDGVPVRNDVELLKVESKGANEYYEIIVGGLPTGDCFPVSENGHICNKKGKIITYGRERRYPESEVIVKATTLASKVTLERLTRSILRIKGRIVKVHPNVVVGADHTVLELRPDSISGLNVEGTIIEGKTKMFDDLAKAQVDYQGNNKVDSTWIKRS